MKDDLSRQINGDSAIGLLWKDYFRDCSLLIDPEWHYKAGVTLPVETYLTFKAQLPTVREFVNDQQQVVQQTSMRAQEYAARVVSGARQLCSGARKLIKASGIDKMVNPDDNDSVTNFINKGLGLLNPTDIGQLPSQLQPVATDVYDLLSEESARSELIRKSFSTLSLANKVAKQNELTNEKVDELFDNYKVGNLLKVHALLTKQTFSNLASFVSSGDGTLPAINLLGAFVIFVLIVIILDCVAIPISVALLSVSIGNLVLNAANVGLGTGKFVAEQKEIANTIPVNVSDLHEIIDKFNKNINLIKEDINRIDKLDKAGLDNVKIFEEY